MVSKIVVKNVLCIIVLIWEVQGDGEMSENIKVISNPPANSPEYDKSALKAANDSKLKDLCYGNNIQDGSAYPEPDVGDKDLDEIVMRLNRIVDDYVASYRIQHVRYRKDSFMKDLEDAKVSFKRLGEFYRHLYNSQTFKKRVFHLCKVMIKNFQVMAKSTFRDYEEEQKKPKKGCSTFLNKKSDKYYKQKRESQEEKFKNQKFT